MRRIRGRTAHLLMALAALTALALGAAVAATQGARAPHEPATAEAAGFEMPRPGERLVLALLEPERIASLDLSTGALTQLLLPGGTLCRSPLLVVDGRILFVQHGRHGGRVMSVDLTLRERPRWIATADVMVASAEPGHVWLATRGVGPHGHWLVQDMSVAGGTIARPPRRAPSLAILGAVSGGLVLQGRGTVFVWDPRTGRRSRATPGPYLLAAQGALVASCGGRCSTLLLADGRRGRVVHAPRRTRFVPAGAALAPAGDLLAVPLTPARRSPLAIVRVETGASRTLPGRRGTYGALAWSPSGTTLYVADPRDGRVRAFAADGRALGTAGPRFGAPIAQMVATADAPRLEGGHLLAPRFAWLPAGWRQFSDAAALPGGPAQGSTFATSWRYHPAPHGPAGALPADGVLVTVLLLRRPLDGAAAPPPAVPLQAGALVLPGRPESELEGRPGVPEYRIRAVCGTHALEVRVDVAAPRLAPTQRQKVQRMLDELVLPPAARGCGGGP
ncbi:MAG: hypothetical protein ACJ76L_05455 [Conexibacter sp.]